MYKQKLSVLIEQQKADNERRIFHSDTKQALMN
jgi:hypothetical protein